MLYQLDWFVRSNWMPFGLDCDSQTYSPGEHIDYALFGVLPAAIERDILVACAPRFVSDAPESENSPGSVVAENLHSKYTRQVFAPTARYLKELDEATAKGWHLDINTKELRWESYVKAGYYVSRNPVSLTESWSNTNVF